LRGCGEGVDEELSTKIAEVRKSLKDKRRQAYVERGAVQTGEEGSLWNPLRELELPGFYVDLHEVTNKEYGRFVAEAGADPPPSWPSGKIPSGAEDEALTGITFEEAQRFAAARGGRLPTPAEWEKAARGAEPHTWPWGDEPREAGCNWAGLGHARPLKPGSLPKDISTPYGLFDMAGNVSEWTYGEGIGSSEKTRSRAAAWVRGGAYMTALFDNTRVAFVAEAGFGDQRDPAVGFRCVYDLEEGTGEDAEQEPEQESDEGEDGE
ncbi:formylglycine-generating enzyme family protein, partial [Planctomycetota bacterium]